MNVDCIIIGQGISGTWLSYYLLKANKSIVVFDNNNLQSASKVAGGLINPVTGRRVVTTWLADELMPFIFKEYTALENYLNASIIKQNNVLIFPAAPDLQKAFAERMQENNGYIKTPSLKKELLYQQFNYPFDVFEISPCYVVQMQELLTLFKAHLQVKNIFYSEMFDEDCLIINDDFIQYKNIQVTKIIYADGIQSTNSKYWRNLPFVANKGQALIIETEYLNTNYSYKVGHLSLIHLNNNYWWVGSSNELNFKTTEPADEFYKSTFASLTSILKQKFIVKQHNAALRAATVERRPFVGFHPLQKQIGILNGMGSKGCSLAPWFAKELAENIVNDKTINVLADVNRYANILQRK